MDHGAKAANVDYEKYVANQTALAALTPFDGQEVFFAADATNGDIWHLRYRSAVGYWECVGGSPIQAEDATSASVTSGSYGNPATGNAGPSITLPLPGDYEFHAGCGMTLPVGVGAYGKVALKIGAAATTDAERVAQINSNGGAGAAQGCYANTRLRRTVSGIGTAVRLDYLVSAGTLTVEHRRIAAMPVRVQAS